MYPEIKILSLEISTYFLILSCVFTGAIFYLLKRARTLGLSTVKALDLYMTLAVSGFVGARVFYILYQEPQFYLKHPEQVLYFWNGGYVFFGGVLGGLLAFYIFCKIKKEKFVVWLNFATPLLSVGYALGRLACLMGGCCYGKEATLPWSVFLHGAYRHPSQLYASVLEFFIFGLLVFTEKKAGFNRFLVLPLWLILHGGARIIMEVYRADPRGAEILGLSISSFISLILMLVGGIMLFQKYKCNWPQASKF